MSRFPTVHERLARADDQDAALRLSAADVHLLVSCEKRLRKEIDDLHKRSRRNCDECGGWPGHFSSCSQSVHAGTPLAGGA